MDELNWYAMSIDWYACFFAFQFTAGATEIENLFSSDFNERATSIIDQENCLFSQDLGKNA